VVGGVNAMVVCLSQEGDRWLLKIGCIVVCIELDILTSDDNDNDNEEECLR
jgi:hypothetical protein